MENRVNMSTKSKTGDKIAELREEARRAAQDLRAARKSNAPREVQLEIMKRRDKCLAQATALRNSDISRLEQVAVYEVTKVRGTKDYRYWCASWRHGEKMHTVHLGSCQRMDKEAALALAKKKKELDLGIEARNDR